MDYAVLKLTYVSCAAISYVLFAVRGIWMMRNPTLLSGRWVKIAPHVVDTTLLAIAIMLAILGRRSADALLSIKPLTSVKAS